MKLWKLLEKDRQTYEFIKKVYPRENTEKKFRAIWKERSKFLLILLLVSIFMGVYCFFSEPEETALKDSRYLERQSEDAQVELYVTGKNGEQAWTKEVSVFLKEEQLDEAEQEELSKKVKDYLDEKLRGENTSLQEVSKPLCLVSELPGTEVVFEWQVDEDYIRQDGTLIRKNILAKGVDTELTVEVSYKNWKDVFSFSLFLLPPEWSEKELAYQEIRKEIKHVLNENDTEEEIELPKQVGEVAVSYAMPENEKSYLPFIVTLFGFLVLPLWWKENQKKVLLEREEQLMLLYPELVNKFMLLLGAGLTVRKAVERLTAEYEEQKEQTGKVVYAYEELCIALREMKDGISEGIALERFGKRCRLIPYLRFSSVVTQNLKKGAEGIIDILEKESMEALEQRKQRVLQMGEKAGTKLLLPMMLMLLLVMVIIMIPAFMTM